MPNIRGLACEYTTIKAKKDKRGRKTEREKETIMEYDLEPKATIMRIN